MLLFTVFFEIIFYNIVCAEIHTKQYEKYESCELDRLFIQDTYGGFAENPCQHISYNNKYKNLLVKNNIKCDASWCISENDYKCPSDTTVKCPNVEHIIDIRQSGEEYKNCDKEILGNMVIAYGEWNKEIGISKNFLKNWSNIKNEKLNVYGGIFNMADFYVRNCNCSGISKSENKIFTDQIFDRNHCYNSSDNLENKEIIAFVWIFIVFAIVIGSIYFSTIPTNKVEDCEVEDCDNILLEDLNSEIEL